MTSVFDSNLSSFVAKHYNDNTTYMEYHRNELLHIATSNESIFRESSSFTNNINDFTLVEDGIEYPMYMIDIDITNIDLINLLIKNGHSSVAARLRRNAL